MERTTNNDWRANARRQPQSYSASTVGTASGGVLSMARRRQERRSNWVALVGLAAALFLCGALFAGVGQVVANWQKTASLNVRKPISPAAAPAAAPAANSHRMNILLLGSDQRGDDRSYRTDVIVLVSIDPAQGTASAVSFPRDLWVEPPTLYPMKINMIQAIGGFEAMSNMFETNFGVRPDYYVLVNFTGFVQLIDSMGGIDVNIGQPLTDSCDLPQAQGGICAVDAGVLPMDGQTALWYVRSRASTSDYDRLRRAQEVVQAVFERLINLDTLIHLPEYYDEAIQHLETNMSLSNISPLVATAMQLFQDPQRIHRFVITEDQATPSWSWDGMWILLPDADAIHTILQEAGIQ